MRMEMLFSTSASAPWPIVLVSDLSCLILCFCPWHLTGWDLESGMEVSDEPLLSSVRDVMDELPQNASVAPKFMVATWQMWAPFVFKPFNVWSAHLLGCDFWSANHFECASMCVWCNHEVVFLAHWLICFFSFLVASFCIFDRHQWLCIICCSQPFSGPSILGWRSSTKPSWHTGVSQCIDIWLGLCSICAALHGAHWDVQTAWATQPAFTSSPSLFPKRGRKAMALTSKHRAHPFFFHFF